MAEVLIYGDITDYSASAFITSLGAVGDGDFTTRINTLGGSVAATWGMIAKYADMPGKKSLKIDGKAMSMGAYFACYADDVECLDVSVFGLHRAAYPSFIESNPNLFDESAKKSLTNVNNNLRKAMTAKIDVVGFEAIAGCSMDEFFSLDNRIDVELTASQAKKIGLVSNITKITPARKQAIEAKMIEITALSTGLQIEAKQSPTNQNQNKIMTSAEIKAQFPQAYAEIFAAGAADEQDRVGSWMAYNDVDPEAVALGIKEGKNLTRTQMSELSLKALSKEKLAALAGENAKDVKPDAAAASEDITAEAKAKKDFMDEVAKITRKEAK